MKISFGISITLAALAALAVETAQSASFCDLIRCTKEIAPVCGSNGVTYDNKCMFTIAKCANDKLSITATGECTVAATTAPPAATAAPVAAACEMMCIDSYEPVCGSDGVTYNNKCNLQLANCNAHLTDAATTISVASQGECAARDDPSTVTPPSANDTDSDPVVTVGPAPEPEPEAPAPLCEMLCSMEYEPVCGSDGVTYSNVCELRRASCKTQDTILTQAAEGECASSDASVATVEPTATPVATGSTPAPTKKCPSICPANFAPVCATDGKTYSNKCQFEAAKCTQGITTMAIASEGACETAATTTTTTTTPTMTTPKPTTVSSSSCKKICTREYKPVCGSDGVTYSNKCGFEIAKCTKRIATMTATEGACAAAV